MKKAIVCSAVLVALAGCNGGTDGTTTRSTTSGVVTGFGSVYVNGVKYETSQARISRDGSQVSDDTDLGVGMVVTLSGTVNADGVTGTAEAISYADDLEGRVLANDTAAGILNVMGYTVSLTGTTVFESKVATVLAPADLVAGEHDVEVSGYFDGQGAITATRIEVKSEADELEVKGVVADLDTAMLTFMLGTGLLVDYSKATELPNLSNGLYVEVKTEAPPLDGDGDGIYTLIANKVELENHGAYGLRGNSGDEVKLQGVVTGVNAAEGSFMVNGQTVMIGADAFTHGETLDDLDALIGTGTPVKVEGGFDASGNLIATEIELGSQGEVEIEAPLEAVNSTAGTLTLLGQTISVTNTTLMRDDRDENGQMPEHRFSLADLAAGDLVEVKAYRARDDDTLVALKLERDDDDGDMVKLEGKVTLLAPLTVEGVEVDVSAISAGLPTLDVGMSVEVEGEMIGDVLVASQVD